MGGGGGEGAVDTSRDKVKDKNKVSFLHSAISGERHQWQKERERERERGVSKFAHRSTHPTTHTTPYPVLPEMPRGVLPRQQQQTSPTRPPGDRKHGQDERDNIGDVIACQARVRRA